MKKKQRKREEEKKERRNRTQQRKREVRSGKINEPKQGEQRGPRVNEVRTENDDPIVICG